MRMPYRKPGKYTHIKNDPLMTEEKFRALEQELERLKNVSLPQAIADVRRLAELGDFSENAAYQIAKGRLRRINYRMLELEDQLKEAVIIKPHTTSDTVQVGHHVTVEVVGKCSTYLILGSSETNPSQGIISHTSPLGAALLGTRVGEEVVVKLANKNITYKIVAIE